MLKDGKLHHKFWEDAMRTANYIYNSLSHQGNSNKIPYQELYNEEVDYQKFRVFDCQVFFLIPKHLRRRFKGTSLPGIFIGYDEFNPNAYLICNTTNNKIIKSKTVEFFEDTPGNASAPNNIPKMYYFEESFEEDEQETFIHDYDKDINNNNNNNNINNFANQENYMDNFSCTSDEINSQNINNYSEKNLKYHSKNINLNNLPLKNNSNERIKDLDLQN